MANWWGRSFLKHARRELRPIVSDSDALVLRIRDYAQTVYRDAAINEPNKKTRDVFAYCSLVLAAYKETRAETNDSELAFRVARMAFHNACEPAWRFIMKTWMFFVRDPVAYLKRKSIVKSSSKMFGPSMNLAEEHADNSVDLVVHKCGFHQFFVDHGEPSLTPVVCVFDHYWMQMMDRSRRPVRTERTSALSLGDDCCRFRFIRDNGKQDNPPVDVVLVQLESQAEHVKAK
jgi:hypothetical protein